MTSRGWTIREAVPEDTPRIADLCNTVFGFRPSSIHVDWKFRQNPDAVPLTVVAEQSGAIVGQYALWSTRLRLGSEVVVAAQSLDTMTHPDFRGQGMFVVLATECMELASRRGVEALYGFPNANSYPGFVRRLDWDHTGDIPGWVRPLSPSRHKRVPKMAGPFADVVSRLLPVDRGRKFEISSEIPTTTTLDRLLAPWKEQTDRCRVERSPERYAWRFGRLSALNYRWLQVMRSGTPVALVIWGTDPRTGNALLSEALGGETDALAAGVGQAVRDAWREGCPLMLSMSNNGQLCSALRRCGFLRRREGQPLIVRKLTRRTLGANVHTHALWDIAASDADTF